MLHENLKMFSLIYQVSNGQSGDNYCVVYQGSKLCCPPALQKLSTQYYRKTVVYL
jgi:hypothetical protein